MRPRIALTSLFALVCVALTCPASAQTNQSATGQQTSAPPEERHVGAYVAAGSIEVGYRFVDLTSTAQLPVPGGGTTSYSGPYDTFEDLREGPRVLETSLSLRSEGSAGVLFDDLFVSSFGWGGDPENVARLRVSKRKFYNLTTLFRRDYQRFDYNLLANPLNPATSIPNVPVLSSPHEFNTVRRMSDINLTLAPQSVISVRLGYDRNRVEGNTFTSFHMPRGTDIQPLQPYNVTTHGFRAGVDLKFIPRTTLSFDGIVQWIKNDTFWQLVDFPFTVGGVPTTLGISWNVDARQPCPAPFLPDGSVNPVCNQGTFFAHQDRYRATMPTTMASLESHYWRRVDLSARAIYGWADLDSRFSQGWTGVTGTGFRQTTLHNPRVRRISSGADFGITFHITDNVRINDSFRFVNHRMPAFATSLVSTIPLTGPETVVAQGLEHGLFTDTKANEVTLELDAGRHLGGHIGYRFTHRDIELLGEGFDIDPVTGERDVANEEEGGFQRYTIPEHTGLAGIWFRPSEKLRINLDAELSSAGIKNHTFDTGEGGEIPTDFTVTGLTTFTRISPRHQQRYRARATFVPIRHVSVSASLNAIEQRNGLQDIDYRFHNRNYGFNANISPNDRVLVDLAYNYQDFRQSNLICTVFVPGPGAFPGSAQSGSGLCPLAPVDLTGSTAPYFGLTGGYNNQVHFGSAMIRVKPVKRVTTSIGYSIVANDGGFSQLNGLQPAGPLQFNYHRPLAAMEIEIAGGLALKGGWNYFGYNEKGPQPGPTLPRDFHANTGTLGLRYSF